MVGVISENIRIFSAEQFKESVSEEANTKLYFTIGRGFPWANDAAPDRANSSVTVFNDVWNNMVGAKRITGNDMHHVIPRYNWSADRVYPAYDHCICSLQLFAANTPFYVVTDEWNVYKCIANNYGANSTSKPVSIATTDVFQTADGYIWKYMYSIPADEQLKFTTDSYIPVKTLSQDNGSLQWDVQRGAIPGAIYSIKLTNFGDGYTNANTISVTVIGDGVSALASATVNTTTNTISSITVVSPGRDYTYATVTITDTGPGKNAAARAIISPPGGHGSDPLRELGGSNLMLNARLRGSEGDILPVNNEYRQVAILSDPLIFNLPKVETDSIVSQLTVLTLNGTSVDYIEDETVYQGASLISSTFSGKVYQWDSPNNIIRLTNVIGNPTTDVLIGANSSAAKFVDSITDPKMKKYTGNLLYIENIAPISRDEDQTEDYKIVFSF